MAQELQHSNIRWSVRAFVTSVEGSGFTVALRVDDNGTTAPYALRGLDGISNRS